VELCETSLRKKRRSPCGQFITFNWSPRFMDKVKKILEKYKIYLGVRDVAVEIRPYKIRTAFTKLSSPPIIHLNEYLIDNEVC
jgi:hypothetical protein